MPSSGIAHFRGSGSGSIPPGARSLSSRAAARADRSAITLGRYGELTVEQARKQAVAVIDRIKRGEDPVAAPPEPAFTVANLAKRYLEAHVALNCNAHTAGIYRGSLDNHILPALGAMAGPVRLDDRRRRRCTTRCGTLPARRTGRSWFCPRCSFLAGYISVFRFQKHNFCRQKQIVRNCSALREFSQVALSTLTQHIRASVDMLPV